MPPGLSSTIPIQRRHPFLHRNENLRQSFDNQSLSERVHLVLDFMKSVNINLPILLWAISWNIPDLISDPKVSAERTALMVSEELPGILAHWRHPPRKHNSGIRTRAAYVTMNKFALDTVLEIIGNEMGALDEVFKSPQSELSEESLLSIKWEEMTAEVRREAPTTWTLFRHAAYTQEQESRNTRKNPDSVNISLLIATYFTNLEVVCSYDDCYGSIFTFPSPL